MVVKKSPSPEKIETMAEDESKLVKILKECVKCTNKPTQYLKENKARTEKNISLLKSLYDYSKSKNLIPSTSNTPRTLHIDDVDEEQLWQQLELENNAMVSTLLQRTSKLLSINDTKYSLGIETVTEKPNENEKSVDDNENDSDFDTDDDDEDNVDTDDDNNDIDEEDDSDSGDNEKVKKNHNRIAKSSILDDGFFNLNEMNEFLDAEDAKEMNKGKLKKNKADNEIDYFESMSDDDEDDKIKNMKFTDFFDDLNGGRGKPRNRKVVNDSDDDDELDEEEAEEAEEAEEERDDEEDNKFNLDQFNSDEDSDESNDQPKSMKKLSRLDQEQSEFESRQQRLRNVIDKLESDALNEKTWQLKGEITSTSRPKNSLLEEVLEFDSTVRPAPIITEATSQCLEDIVMKRIKSKAWDDVERKFKPQNDVAEYKKQLILDQEKSKESLAQIYEKDYLNAVNKLKNPDDKQQEEPKEYKEIRNAVKSLFLKLDSLSNFHFTVKPVAIEPKIITNIPAISMEEVAPVAERDTTMLAPEEVLPSVKGDVVGNSERTATDKNRQRRQKKLKQKLIQKQKEKRLEEQQKKGVKISTKDQKQAALDKVSKHRNVIKSKEMANTKSIKASSQFFSQLQDNVSNSVGKKKRSLDLKETKSNAKRLKL